MMSKELTPSETIVLGAIYKIGDANTHDIIEHVKERKTWNNANIESFLVRLWAKGYVARTRYGRLYQYTPIRPLNDVVAEVLDKLFGKSLSNNPIPIVEYLMYPRKLTESESELINKILSLD